MSLIPWSRGSTLIWDATCTYTLTLSNLRFSSKETGKAAENKANRNKTKYRSLISQNYFSVPFSMETMEQWCHSQWKHSNQGLELSSDSSLVWRFFKRGNVAAVMGRFRSCDNMDEIYVYSFRFQAYSNALDNYENFGHHGVDVETSFFEQILSFLKFILRVSLCWKTIPTRTDSQLYYMKLCGCV